MGQSGPNSCSRRKSKSVHRVWGGELTITPGGPWNRVILMNFRDKPIKGWLGALGGVEMQSQPWPAPMNTKGKGIL